ncbi:hypothetical protein EBR21_04245 [bacterium]|nr:hypothetical protein [bacterium]
MEFLNFRKAIPMNRGIELLIHPMRHIPTLQRAMRRKGFAAHGAGMNSLSGLEEAAHGGFERQL